MPVSLISKRSYSVSGSNRVSMLGDSITGATSPGISGVNTQVYSSGSPIGNMLYAQPKMIPWGAYGTSGHKSADALARIGDITGATIKPDVCVVLLGTNDAGNGVTVSAFIANMTAIFNTLRSAGIKPVATSIPPQPNVTVQTGITRRLLASRYNVALKLLAAKMGVPFIDYLSSVQDTTNGAWLSGLDSGDGIHPSHAGHQAIGNAIGIALDKVLGEWSPPFPMHPVAADNVNLVPNAMFLVDSNADGTPDSWTKTGTVTSSILVAPGAPVVGNAIRLQGTDGSFTQVTCNFAASVWSPGDRIAYCGRFKVNGAPATGAPTINFSFTGATPAQTVRGLTGYSIDSGGWRTFYMEHVVPTGSTTGGIALTAQGTSIDLQVAQLGAYNLTSLGIVL